MNNELQQLIAKCDAAKANGDPTKYLAGLTVDEAHRIARFLDRLVPPTPTGPKRKMICGHCGSNRVLRDAYAEWDFARQEWVLQNVFDYAVCCSKDCDGNETSIKEEEETDGQAPADEG